MIFDWDKPSTIRRARTSRQRLVAHLAAHMQTLDERSRQVYETVHQRAVEGGVFEDRLPQLPPEPPPPLSAATRGLQQLGWRCALRIQHLQFARVKMTKKKKN